MTSLTTPKKIDSDQVKNTKTKHGEDGDPRPQELREWMMQYADGDTKAFSPLYSVLHPAVFRFHLCSTRRPEVAEDLTQKTFLKLHVARQRYRKGAPVKPWVFTIAKNVQRDLFRRQQRSREDLLEAADSRWSQCATEQKQDDPLMQDKLQQAIHSLPGGQRDVILLHKFEGFSMAEVAAALQIGVSAAKVRAHRGYAALRTVLDGDHGFMPASQLQRASKPQRTVPSRLAA